MEVDMDIDYFFQHLPRDELGEVLKHISLNLDELYSLEDNIKSKSRVRSIQPKDSSDKRSIPYFFTKLYPNVINIGYPIDINTVDEFIELASNTKIRQASINLEYFSQRIVSYSSGAKENIIGQHYKTDKDLINFFLMIEGENYSKVSQLTLSAYFINIRVEAERINSCNRVRKPFFFQLGEYVSFTQNSLTVKMLGYYIAESLLNNITQRYFMREFEGMIYYDTLEILPSFPCLEIIRVQRTGLPREPNITPLLDAGYKVEFITI